MEAAYYTKEKDNKVTCNLCPHNCIISNGKYGFCRVRHNVEGELIAENYQKYSAINFDPIEKKPLYHFYPGKEILSLGSVGCNMRCLWCQNCEISQEGINSLRQLKKMASTEVMEMALKNSQNIGVAYTYNEPVISIESVLEVAKLAKLSNLKNVLVTNGCVNEIALIELLTCFDAFNIDVKSFNNEVCRKYTGVNLSDILHCIEMVKKAGKHLELTYLIVPGVNDDISDFYNFVDWLRNKLGKEIVLHLSRYFPRYQMTVEATAPEMLEKFADVANEKLDYIYVGNYNSHKYEHTKCPSCKKIIINRSGYSVYVVDGETGGICSNCGKRIYQMD